MVVAGRVSPTWLPDDRFWYRNAALVAPEIVVIDPAARKRERCAASAIRCAGIAITGDDAGARRGRAGRRGDREADRGNASEAGPPLTISPDGIRFPGVFKVGIAESGNHDQRVNEDDWGERHQRLLVGNADGTDNYEAEANQRFAKNLTGHLLLAHGTMDTNVPRYQTLLAAAALIKANKDFDLLLIPNANRGYGAASRYMMRRRWDYFVRWLLGIEPPTGVDLSTLVPPAR